ncbi:MAG: peptidoglycan-binding protein [Patescibacteria group bacterium]
MLSVHKSSVSLLAFVLTAGLLSAIFLLALPSDAHAACSVSRDLRMGMSGSDVRCVQDQLRSEGYLAATPTGYYGPATYNAVARMQAAHSDFPDGTLTRYAYDDYYGAYGSSYNNSYDDRDSRDDADREDALDAIEDAEDAYEDALDEVEDARGDTRDAEDALDDAKDALKDAEEAFDDRDYDEAIDYAEEAEDRAEDALDELDESEDDYDDSYGYDDDYYDYSYDPYAGYVSSYGYTTGNRTVVRSDFARDYAEDAIESARVNLIDARDKARYADAWERRYVERTLLDAQDALEDAREAYSDGAYDEARDLARESKSLSYEAKAQIN